MQFTGAQVMVQHLVVGGTSTLLTMPTVTLIHPQALAPLTLFQVEYKASTQSWLGLVSSHLMRWRCFILTESPRQDVAINLYLLDVSVALYNLYMSRMLMAESTKRPVWQVHIGLIIIKNSFFFVLIFSRYSVGFFVISYIYASENSNF